MSDYITTFTGCHINPMQPDADLINLEDIAHSLSLQCRANGHFPRFYTVAQHCIDCAIEAKHRKYNKSMQLACLLHDAAEAYFADIPKPVKQYFPEYEQYEIKLLDVIYQKYLGKKLSVKEWNIVSGIDRDLFCHEFLVIMGEQTTDVMPELYSNPLFKTRPAIEVEEEYKRCFRRLISK